MLSAMLFRCWLTMFAMLFQCSLKWRYQCCLLVSVCFQGCSTGFLWLHVSFLNILNVLFAVCSSFAWFGYDLSTCSPFRLIGLWFSAACSWFCFISMFNSFSCVFNRFILLFHTFVKIFIYFHSFPVCCSRLLQACCCSILLLQAASCGAGCDSILFCYAMLVFLRNHSCQPASRISSAFCWSWFVFYWF